MIGVARRFHRSVSLTLDWQRPSALQGYVVSPLVDHCVSRIAGELSRPDGSRAWSLVGPFGTGKSAFALFMATLLAESGGERTTLGAELSREAQGAVVELPDRRWMPVLITGERGPILDATVRAMLSSLEGYRAGRRGKPPAVHTALAAAAQQESPLSQSQVLALIDDLLAYADARCGGVLFVYDELGKFLEFAASQPARSDTYFLQQLAERAARSATPLGLVTILHQSFALYASHLPVQERAEWEKVQGRFEEIPFLEPVEHLVRLAGAAIERNEPLRADRVALHSEALARLSELTEISPSKAEALASTDPIHPIVGMLLGPVFRGALSQNERSLFAFLVAPDPGGFVRFLDDSDGRPDGLYGVDEFFQYINSALAARVAARRRDRMWSLVERAISLEREAPDGETRVRLLRAIALLGRFGHHTGLRADVGTISLATGVSEGVVVALAESMTRSVVFRKFSATYHLWDGSDVDLEAEIGRAREAVTHAGGVAAVLEKHVALRPVVAGRHLHRTGTLRVLEPRLVDETAVRDGIGPADASNGLVVYVLPRSKSGAAALAQDLRSKETRRRFVPHPASIVVVATEPDRVREHALHLLSLDRALASSKALQVDLVARRELRIQLADASNRLMQSLGDVFGWSGRPDPGVSSWFGPSGELKTPPLRLSRLGSDVLDEAFSLAPALRHELLNRSKLTSQAAAARRDLVQAMIENGRLERLGFEGHPPSLSMYLTIVEPSGAHQPRETTPWVRPAGPIGEVCAEVLRFLRAEDAPVRVDHLYTHLRRPPFGLRDGVLPVLLVIQLLAEGDELSLFEDGSLVPELDVETAERLLRRPGTFRLRAYLPSPARIRFLAGLLSALQAPSSLKPTVLNATRVLLRAVLKLAPYARSTSDVSVQAKRVRVALLSARDPHKLLFEQLPTALDLVDPAADVYIAHLGRVIGELSESEPRLTQRLREKLLRGFGASTLSEIVERAGRLPAKGIPALLTGFQFRTLEATSLTGWVFEVATFLLHRPPDRWRDGDETSFDVRLRELVDSFDRYEVLGARWGESKENLLSLALSTSTGDDLVAVAIDQSDSDRVTGYVESILGEARRLDLSRDQLLSSVAVAFQAISRGEHFD